MHVLGRSTVRSVTVALVLSLFAACSGGAKDAQGTPDDPSSLTAAVEAVQEQVDIYQDSLTGIVVLVRVGDQTDVVTVGDADVAQHVPLALGQTFAVASITKPMVAAVVLQLADEGRLALDDDAHQWLPELRRVRVPITVEQLLSHRSGLREITPEDVDRVGRDRSVLLKAVAADPLLFEPGTDGSYVNLNYAALGLIVQRILDQPLDEVLEERVFTPAGMTATSLAGTPDVHDYAAGKDVTATNDLELFGPAAGVVSTVGDLDRFFAALWSGDLVDGALVDDMRTPRGTLPPYGNNYGLGLGLAEFRCGTAVGHDGEMAGILTGAWTSIDDDQRFVAVLINDDSSQGARHGIVEAALCP